MPLPSVTELPGNLSRDRGILTMARGHAMFVEMAKTLALSLRQFNDHIPRVVVTDRDDPDLRRLYHACIPVRREFGTGSGNEQKLFLDEYSPFEETIFLDSDVFVVRNIDGIWDLFRNVSFGVVGNLWTRGYYHGDVPEILRRTGLKALPAFNGGLVYFRRDDVSAAINQTVRHVLADYDQYGFEKFRGGASQEIVTAVAMGMHGVAPIDDGGKFYRPINPVCGPVTLDVLTGRCRYRVYEHDGRGSYPRLTVEPAITHFPGKWRDDWLYQRECHKLRWRDRSTLPPATISRLTNLRFAPRAVGGFFNRLAQRARHPRTRPKLPVPVGYPWP